MESTVMIGLLACYVLLIGRGVRQIKEMLRPKRKVAAKRRKPHGKRRVRAYTYRVAR